MLQGKLWQKRLKVTWTKQFLKIVQHSPHKQFIVCKPTNTSPPTLAISVCQSPSVCHCVCPNNSPVHAKQTFSYSVSRFLQKYAIKLSGFRVCGPHLFLFRLLFPILGFVMVKVPQSRRALLIHTNDCLLFDVIQNAGTILVGLKNVATGNHKCRINWIKMELLLLGKGTITFYWAFELLRRRESIYILGYIRGYLTHTLISLRLLPGKKELIILSLLNTVKNSIWPHLAEKKR